VRLAQAAALSSGVDDLSASNLQFRDLRRTLATALGAAGCTDDQIRAITGHQTREVIAVYVRPNDAFAKAAMGRLQHARKNTS
jgi:integrase